MLAFCQVLGDNRNIVGGALKFALHEDIFLSSRAVLFGLVCSIVPAIHIPSALSPIRRSEPRADCVKELLPRASFAVLHLNKAPQPWPQQGE